MIATGAGAQYAARPCYRVVSLLAFDELKCSYRVLSVSLAKKAAARLGISRSSRRILVSLRGRLSSSLSSVASPGFSPRSISA